MPALISQEKIVSVLGLFIKCPLEKPLDDCPANKFRILSFNEKYQLALNMKEEDLDVIISKHKRCLRIREKELYGKSSIN